VQQNQNRPVPVKVVLSRDKLTALICSLGKQDFIDTGEIYRELEKAGVRFGIKEDAVAKFSMSPAGEPVVIASGVPPTPGKDGYLEILFNKKPVTLNIDSDVVDFRETSTVVSVEAGEQLVEVHPPSPGTQGIAVTGEAVDPPRPREIRLQAGKGVVLSEEGTRAYAQVGGRPWLREAGLLKIVYCEPLYVHNGDVDIKTGHLRFKGDVRVLGNVCEAMEVEAAGVLEVQGLITMARVISMGKIVIHGNVISSRIRAGILFPGAKKLGFMLSDMHTELQSLANILEQLKSRRITDFEVVDFGRVVLGLMDSRFKNIRPMVKNIQTFAKDKTDELPQEVIGAINSLNCFSGLKPLNQEIFRNAFDSVTGAVDMISRSKGEDSASVTIKSSVSSVIQSAGIVMVTGQGCVNTNITSGGNVYIKGSFKGGEILCEGDAEIDELGSSLGVPPVVRVAAGSTVRIKKAFEGSVIQVGNRRVTLSRDMESFKAKLNKDGQLELY